MKIKIQHQNLWVRDKEVLRGIFTALNSYITHLRFFLFSNLTFHFKNLEKEELYTPKESRREIIRTNAKKIESRIINEKILFGNFDDIDKSLQDWQKIENTQITNIRNEKVYDCRPCIHQNDNMRIAQTTLYIYIWQLRWNGPIP